jgi:hypothetical protein
MSGFGTVGTTLQTRLDGKLLEFELNGGRRSTDVPIPPVWEGPPRVGHNDGTVGVVFTADLNRRKLGGQCARNFMVRPATRLLSAR